MKKSEVQSKGTLAALKAWKTRRAKKRADGEVVSKVLDEAYWKADTKAQLSEKRLEEILAKADAVRVTSTPRRDPPTDTAVKRSAAALKAWKTRRARAAAKKAWETRRQRAKFSASQNWLKPGQVQIPVGR